MAKVMALAQQLRHEIEAQLSHKMAGALTAGVRPDIVLTPTGIAAVDRLLRGGIPAGVLSELVGTACSGRTTIALAHLASVTQSGGVCAWIDVADSFDPESAAANGVLLDRMLWVRCGAQAQHPVLFADENKTPPGTTLLSSSSAPARHPGGGSPHPRSEARDMPEAISAMLRQHGGLYDKEQRRNKRMIGTPGAPNRPLTMVSEDREEQVNSDRLPPRRGQNLTLAPRCAEPQSRRLAQPASARRLSPAQPESDVASREHKPWQSLDRALRTTDLLLQTGGFQTIVLDLGSVAPEAAWRIPLATWFRFRAACERTRVSLVLLTQHSCARSSAELVVRLQPGSLAAQSNVMTGAQYAGEAERSRNPASADRVIPIRKPPQPEHFSQWISEAAWAQAK